MKSFVVVLSLLVAGLTTCAVADEALAYSNGPTNGTTDAWAINFGFVVSDSFTVTDSPLLTHFMFAAWLVPGDILENAELSITSQEFGGTVYFDQMLQFNQSGCVSNQYGYNVCTETAWLGYLQLDNGTYWVNLQNAEVPSGDPVYWDENSGPSSASQNSIGTVPSEAFTIMQYVETTGVHTTAEPGSIMLLGSGVLGLAGLLRRRIL